MPAVCVKHQGLKQLAKGARIIKVPRMACNNSTVYAVNNAFPGTYQVATHASCICNEMRALHNRHLIDRLLPEYDSSYYYRWSNKIMREFHFEHVDPVSYHQIIRHYSGSKRNAYLRAYQTIKENGFDKNWAYINMFVKPDKYPSDDALSKAPRAIQYRKPMFNLSVARYLHPIESWFYNSTSLNGFRFSAKGLNNVDRAILLQDIASSYNNPCYILLDHSAFDSSITVDHLKSCHRFYRRLNPSRHLQRLLKFQLNNKGFSKNGICYKVKGTRMSGDYDTALGNTLVNYIVLRSWLRHCNVHGDIILDGDDSVVVIERSNLHKLSYDHFAKMGFTTKHEVVFELDEVEFCQSKFLPSDPPRFARNPLRALSRYNISVRSYHGSGWFRYLAGVGLGEMAVSVGVPILSIVGAKLASLSNNPLHDTESLYRSAITGTTAAIDATVRDAFYRAWGISPDEQVAIESDYTPSIRASFGLLQSFLSLPGNAAQTSW